MPSTKKSKKPTKARVKMPPPTKPHVDRKKKDRDEWATKKELLFLAKLVGRHLEMHEMEQRVRDKFQGQVVKVYMGHCDFCSREQQLMPVFSDKESDPAMLCQQCLSLMRNREAAH